ncbi:MAG: response regulator [Candidatus Omnitrophica bacterium]|nr:response regulator [Candidatus Omnitrophota bacterium]
MSMPARPKILLLDDDPDVLELYAELLSRLPSQPEIRRASSGGSAIAMLAAEPFSLLLCDVKMPNMDGLQVLATVRRRFPNLRTAVLTVLTNEQIRMRAYAMGLDLYLEKPRTAPEIRIFLDCVESLLGQELRESFHQVQSKNLLDMIQLECLSQGSQVLKVHCGNQSGSIWLQNGEIIDAAIADLKGKNAFQRIVSWKTSTFEILPDEPSHPRAIFDSYQALLQESVRELEEGWNPVEAGGASSASLPAPRSLADLAALNGVEFALRLAPDKAEPVECCALENPQPVAGWMRQTMNQFGALGAAMQAGGLQRVDGFGLQRHVVVAVRDKDLLGVGFHRNMSRAQMVAIMNTLIAQLPQ